MRKIILLILGLSMLVLLPACDEDEGTGLVPEFCWNQKAEGLYRLEMLSEEPRVVRGRETEVFVTINEVGKVTSATGRLYVSSADSLALNIPVVYCQFDQAQTWSQRGSCFELRTYCPDCNAGELLRLCLGESVQDTLCKIGFWSKSIASDACDYINFYGEGSFIMEPADTTDGAQLPLKYDSGEFLSDLFDMP